MTHSPYSIFGPFSHAVHCGYYGIYSLLSMIFKLPRLHVNMAIPSPIGKIIQEFWMMRSWVNLLEVCKVVSSKASDWLIQLYILQRTYFIFVRLAKYSSSRSSMCPKCLIAPGTVIYFGSALAIRVSDHRLFKYFMTTWTLNCRWTPNGVYWVYFLILIWINISLH